MRAYIAMTLIATGFLAGCAPTEQEYGAIVTALQGSKRLRTEIVSECAKNFNSEGRRSAGIILDVADKDAPRLACSRYLNAVVSGRVTYQDMLDVKNRRYTPKLVKIFQGR
jgi:hypothetical protein